MLEVVEQIEGQAIIFSRFTKDIDRIIEALNNEYGNDQAVRYDGTNVRDRDNSIKLFLGGNARFFVANQAAASTGLNLQTGGCQHMIFYSNSFDYIAREQAEGRIHRLGTRGAVTYIDLVASKSIDGHILKNLRNKKNISDLTLDSIRKSLVEF